VEKEEVRIKPLHEHGDDLLLGLQDLTAIQAKLTGR
jgi:hypothetical protein